MCNKHSFIISGFDFVAVIQPMGGMMDLVTRAHDRGFIDKEELLRSIMVLDG